MLNGIMEAIVLAVSCSLDAFAASFAYGGSRIKLPVPSILIVSAVCSGVLCVSLLAGAFIRQYLPSGLTAALCCAILLVLGVVKLMDGFTKALIRKHNSIEKQIGFSMFNFRFILRLYSDPIDADVDASKTISPSEAAALALSLSLDGLAVGFGAALGSANIAAAVTASLLVNTLALALGSRAGAAAAGRLAFDPSWLSGAILIALAILKLF